MPDTPPPAADVFTHEVENQPPPFVGYNAWAIDPALRETVARSAGDWGAERLSEFGAVVGSARMVDLAETANRVEPRLHSHDRFGHRIDEVEFHPAWHELMTLAKGSGQHSLPWTDDRPGAHVVRAALVYLQGQGENGAQCPIAMTFAGVPALRHQPDVAEEWVPRLNGTEYDPRFIPAEKKTSALMGMAMTEKQGGSDVRANTTRAVPIGPGGPGGEYLLTGHKWFCSAPMCDVFLTLAYTDKGLTCFLVPRWLPDGTRNRFFIQRLKNKLGNKSNASSEIEYNRTWARMVGEEGRGVATILQMVHHTRLECSIGSAGIVRQALTIALHHARHRSAFQKRLVDQPLMRQVLADLALESEAMMAGAMRLARAFDEAMPNRNGSGDGEPDPAKAAFARIATPILKYWICKRCAPATYEAMEVLGGNGYVEDAPMARLFRESPLNGIWEGSGNVMCLDVLRAMAKEPDAVGVLADELRAAAGSNAAYDAHVKALEADLVKGHVTEGDARWVVERLALALQAAELVQHAPAAVSDAFCQTRLGGERGMAFGAIGGDADHEAILQRAMPA